MLLTDGQRIGVYEVTGLLGAGGMGEVYRANDTRLGRAVAIKILPLSVAQDPERLARFDREARTLAALNHPNIAALHGIEELAVAGPAGFDAASANEAGHSIRALIMELVEGPTLAERIAEGPVPFNDALPIARQIADGLAAAHDQGIVHRDLKPANIKVRDDGTVKVLDFGLAKAIDASAGIGHQRPVGPLSPTLSPTITSPAMTQAGLILGTAAYMSPEQARGKVVDKRADIWAFGCVLYELLTGQRAFDAEDVSLTLSVVLQREPDFAALPASVPAHVTQTLRTCLRKDPRQRASDVQDVRLALEGAFTPPPAPAGDRAAEPTPDGVAAGRHGAARARLLRAALAAAVIVAVFSTYSWWRASRPVAHPPVQLPVDLGPEAEQVPRGSIALSPDGTRLVFVGTGPQGSRQLFTRLLSERAAVPMPGTQQSDGLVMPFFSPDGKWVGFVAGDRLLKIPAEGGPVGTVFQASSPIIAASWGDDDSIVVSIRGELLSVSTSGGAPRTIVAGTFFSPHVLPGSRTALVSDGNVNKGNIRTLDDSTIQLIDLKTGAVKPLTLRGYSPRYLQTAGGQGYLVFVQRGTLYGVSFDAERLDVRGVPTSLIPGIGSNDLVTGGGQFTFSDNGTIAYLDADASGRVYPISWLNASGEMKPLVGMPGAYGVPRLSPDGKRLAYVSTTPKGSDVWVYDLQQGTNLPLTLNSPGFWEVAWAPDSLHLVYPDRDSLWWVRADGAGEPLRIIDKLEFPRAFSFTPDGRLAFGRNGTDNYPDIWTIPLDLSDPDRPKPGKPEPFLASATAEVDGAFSPDGKFFAYSDSEQGGSLVFVQPFPGPGGKRLISPGGGKFPLWSRDRLMFLGHDDRLMVVDYKIQGTTFLHGNPRPWSPTQIFRDGVRRSFDISADGTRAVVFQRPADVRSEGSLHATFVLNFFDEVQRRLR
jgi:serine/threonine-protein kinase